MPPYLGESAALAPGLVGLALAVDLQPPPVQVALFRSAAIRSMAWGTRTHAAVTFLRQLRWRFMRTIWDPPSRPGRRRIWLSVACTGLAYTIALALFAVVRMIL
jgi:hypothetical protein